MDKQEVREKIAEIIFEDRHGVLFTDSYPCERKELLELADSILSIPGLVILAEDQGLPEPPVIAGDRATDYYSGWYAAMEAMLDTGFRKV